MNILYIAPERRSAQAAASALHRFAQNVTLTWAQTPAAALGWLRDNRNAQAVIVDAESQNAAGTAFLEQVRRLGVATPIAVIAPEHLQGLLTLATASLDAVVEQERHNKGVVEARLNKICTVLQDRVLELETANRAATEGHIAQAAARKTLEQRLDAAEASCREIEATHAAEVAELNARLADRDAQHEASLTRTNRICTVLQERLLELEDTLRSADERHADDVAAADRLASLESELAAAVGSRASELAAAVERCATLERQVSEQTTARSLANERFAAAEIARQRAEARHAMRMAALNSDLADLKARHDAVVNQHGVAERHLRETSASLEEAVARIAELTATSERLASRESELDAALVDAIAAKGAVEQQLTDAVVAHERAHQEWLAERAATAGHLARRESELGALLAAETAARIAVERRLVEAEGVHQRAQQQTADDLTAAAERHAALEDRLKSEIDARAMLADQLSAADRSRQQADAGHARAVEALTTQVADLQTQHASALEHSASVERRLTDAETAHQQAQQKAQAEHARAVESLTTQVADLQAQHARAVEHSASVERRLTDAEAAHQQAQQQAEADLAAAAERHATLEGQLKAEVDAREMLADRLAAADRARQDADTDHARTIESLTAQLADLQAQHAHVLEHSASVERRLADAETAHQHAQQQAEAGLAAAAERQTELEDRLKAEIDAHVMLADQLSAADRAREYADADYARAMESWTTQLADLQARHDRALEQIASAERQLADVVATHEQTSQRWESERAAAAERLARRETELSTALADEVAARTAVEQRMVDAESAHQHAQQQAETALAAAANRYADLEARVSAAERARQQADADHARAVAALTTRLTDLQTQHDSALEQITSAEQQLTEVVATHHQAYQNWETERTAAAEQLARRETDLTAALAEEVAARLAVEHSLADAEGARQRAQWQATSDLAAAAERQAALEGRLAEATAARATLEERLAAAEIDRRDADQRFTAELADLRKRLGDLQAHHNATVTERGRDITQLQQERDGLRRQLNVMRTHAATLRSEADRVAGLQLQLAESQKEIRRQFERAPYGLFECTKDGGITRVNNVLARLLGYRASLEAPREEFVTAVFECAADLQWLLERAAPAGPAGPASPASNVQSVETTLKTRDRRRLFVRLHALTTGRTVLVAVEDLTKLSTLEQRVREAQRLEAVGRVASEVAVTCDTLLRDVTQGGQRWLAGFESDTSLRQQGELLLGDVTRAAGLLRQFADYGHTQITNVEPVSVQRVLQDMKPVLERVLGDDIALTLPKTTRAAAAFDVDVEAARVERILVNVANYARERMPQGGHVRIQLATTLVDQRFLASHPRVRPGAHVVITISEVQGATRPTLPIQWPTVDPHGRVTRSPTEKPGMDLGPLMALISDLGGHLWMSVEPAGNVTLQIHLPKRTQDEAMEPAAPGALTVRRRPLARWFRH